jgi:hypothetical protein
MQLRTHPVKGSNWKMATEKSKIEPGPIHKLKTIERTTNMD